MKIESQFQLTKVIVRAALGKVTNAEWCVLIVIADHVSHKNDWEAWPTIEQIAMYSRLSERTVHRAIRSLVEKGILQVKSGKKGQASHYKILVEALDPSAHYHIQSITQTAKKPSWHDDEPDDAPF